jgi:HSP20 family protein
MAVRNLIPRIRSRAPVVSRESANPLVAFHQEMNRLFDEFWRDFGGFGSSLTPSFGFPHIEVSETDKEVKVEAELPGMGEKDIELLLENGVLTLRGEKKSETEDRSRSFSERYYGRFERQITLPVEVQEDKISASFKKGVLTVTLPKSAEATEKVKRIPINGK